MSSTLRRGALFLSVCVELLLAGTTLRSQIEPPTGIRENTPDIHALINARIVTAPGRVIEQGAIVIRRGVIESVGADVRPPADARIWDMTGMTIYPGLIDGYSDIGMPKKQQQRPGGDQPQPAQNPQESRGAKHWNINVKSSETAQDLFVPDTKAAEKLRSMGFVAALVMPQQGIFRGSGAVISLGDGTASRLLIKEGVAQGVAFETSQGDDYPNSLMGAIALIRQTLYDTRWHRDAMAAWSRYPSEPKPEYVPELAALEPVIDKRRPVIFETQDELAALRAAQLSKELGIRMLIRGSGYEYRRLSALKPLSVPIFLPLNFPEAPSVRTPEDELNVTEQELRHWDQAPENAGILQSAGIEFALTTSLLKDPASFLPNLRKAVERGLNADAALAATTVIPSRLFGVERILGTLDRGKIASLVVTDGDLFAAKTKIRETWISGKRYVVKPKPEYDPRGTWHIAAKELLPDSMSLSLKGEVEALQGTSTVRQKEIKIATAVFSDMRLMVSLPGDSIGIAGIIRMTGSAIGSTIIGTGETGDGRQFSWRAERMTAFVPERDTTRRKPVQMSELTPTYPPGEFGRASLPLQPKEILIRDATVWTCGPQGVLEHADVRIRLGKIADVGKDLTATRDAVIINGAGKHITPGIIDCHSHIAVAGSVNETGETITAEVRIGDVIDCDDISIYRQLAGGVTAANILHGSANPIGGQNQVIKLRWGALPEEMKFEGAMPGIKFALGENPKQSNWGDRYRFRYPQSRAGVEQSIRDEFKSALDYEQRLKDFQSGKRRIPPRRDLRAESILEILRGKRLVHCHSYRQDEILMLVRVAQDFGFRIGTFQHVLEGYKVADELAKGGIGGSCFSDWWAYKFEVYDAIPYAGALMHDAGVVTSFNSDSDELARRLNTEAAKAVKYGGVTEEEALKFVTLNAAKQLRIDKRVGSIEPGKDADIAIWKGSPLSTYSMCDQTWIDGRKYFDREEDRELNRAMHTERARLVQKVLSSLSEGGEPGRPSQERPKERYSCHEHEQEGR